MDRSLIRVGGVPEHFNMPWHWAINNGIFSMHSIDVEWKDFPGGTGAMNKSLHDKEIDVAMLLTEGAIVDIINNNNYKILQWYIKSPLTWGIHVSANSDIHKINQIKGRKYAVSRLGSGSHLMAKIDNIQRGFNIEDNQLVIVDNIDGAVKALNDEKADVFMWEKFTTKPLVDANIFRRIGECSTPWPSFVIVVRNEYLEKNSDVVMAMQYLINKVLCSFKKIPFCSEIIAERYKLNHDDIKDWFRAVQWMENNEISKPKFMNIQAMLLSLGIINKQMNYNEMIIGL